MENRPDVPLGYEEFYILLERITIALEKIAENTKVPDDFYMLWSKKRKKTDG
jgi:hypothetical protein